jgi:hypothetical protein
MIIHMTFSAYILLFIFLTPLREFNWGSTNLSSFLLLVPLWLELHYLEWLHEFKWNCTVYFKKRNMFLNLIITYHRLTISNYWLLHSLVTGWCSKSRAVRQSSSSANSRRIGNQVSWGNWKYCAPKTFFELNGHLNL